MSDESQKIPESRPIGSEELRAAKKHVARTAYSLFDLIMTFEMDSQELQSAVMGLSNMAYVLSTNSAVFKELVLKELPPQQASTVLAAQREAARKTLEMHTKGLTDIFSNISPLDLWKFVSIQVLLHTASDLLQTGTVAEDNEIIGTARRIREIEEGNSAKIDL